MFMTIAPAMFVALGSVAVNASFLIYTITRAHPMPSLIIATSSAVFASFFNFYLVLYFFGLITTISEWKKINCAPLKKILYTFTFPVFIFTYIPISLEALFKKIEWVPITHSISKSIEEVRQ